MPVPHDQLIMGLSVSGVCLAGILKRRWFLLNTRKGRALVTHFGDTNAARVLSVIFLLGALFGVLLATGVVRPISW